jgi:thiamine-phosphate pyrophosphorylase
MKHEPHPAMQIIVISPDAADAREVAAMAGLFAEGLARYHVRKPHWTEQELESFLLSLPEDWRPRLVLHGNPGLAERLSLGGSHDRDEGGIAPERGFSRACHDLPSLWQHLPVYEQILFGPVFPSLTKEGYGPEADFPWAELQAILTSGRRPGDARVLAIGGVTAAGLPRCRELGFDGAAVLGAVWNEPQPVRAYAAIRDSAVRWEAAGHAH